MTLKIEKNNHRRTRMDRDVYGPVPAQPGQVRPGFPIGGLALRVIGHVRRLHPGWCSAAQTRHRVHPCPSGVSFSSCFLTSWRSFGSSIQVVLSIQAMKPAVFLDQDGVLVEDRDLITRAEITFCQRSDAWACGGRFRVGGGEQPSGRSARLATEKRCAG
jgi:hypothetical protein